MMTVGEWGSGYLALREEVMVSIKKQDQLFTMLLTSFGVLVTLLSANKLSTLEVQILCLAMIFVSVVFQCKTMQYRDTVYYVSTYLKYREKEDDFDLAWENDLELFYGKRTAWLSEGNSSVRVSFYVTKFTRVFKDASFSIFSVFTFLMLITRNNLLSGSWDLNILNAVVMLVAIVLLAFSLVMFWCVRKDRNKRRWYTDIWRIALKQNESEERESFGGKGL